MDNTREFVLYLFDDESNRKKSLFLTNGGVLDDDERNTKEIENLWLFLDTVPLGSRIRFCVTFEPLPIPDESNQSGRDK